MVTQGRELNGSGHGADYVHEIIDAEAHILYVFAQVDIYEAPRFEAEMGKLNGARRIVVDLTQCRYMDSSGIAVLVRAYKTLGDRLRVVAPAGSQIDRVLRITEINKVIPISATVEEARQP